jgi:hypothetical protein
MQIDMSKATDKQLAIIRFDDPMATKADRTDAENEALRRQVRRSGKPIMVTKRSQGFRR